MEIKDYIKNIDGAERRFFESEVRAVAPANNDTEENMPEVSVIEGYAAKFNSVTNIGGYWEEEILPGAFDDVLGDDVRCLFNHNPNYILARSIDGKGTLTLSIDEIGLKYSYESPDRSYAEDLRDAIAKGDVSQSSFAFSVAEQKWIYGDPMKGTVDKRQIVKFAKLYDVSPVTYPAYADTEVAQRSLDNFKNENQNKGLSLAEAQLSINKNLI